MRGGLLGTFLIVAQVAPGADFTPAGLWKTIDDHTGRVRGLVRIFERNGGFFGKVEATASPEESKQICSPCPGERKNKPVIGLVVLTNMKRQGNEYSGGEILDPDTGSIYKCKMRLVDGGRKLILRGYIGFSLLGRTQVWVREK